MSGPTKNGLPISSRIRRPGSRLPEGLREADVSEHRILVGRLFGNGLNDVPMLDDLAVLHAEDIDDSRAALLGAALRMDVEID